MLQNRSRRRRRLVLVIAAAAALAFAAYAFTATNTVPDSKAGDGDGAISGYTVSNIEYQLDTTNPADIDSVSLDLDEVAGTVKVKVDASDTTYADCANTGGNSWSCDFTTNPAVVDADEFRVIAVQ